MARGNSTATAGANAGLANSNTLSGEGSGLYSTLAPSLEAEAAAPPGYSPSDMSALRTTATQAAGGSQAAAQGEGALAAARTRNNAAFAPAISQATRTAGQGLTNALTGVQSQDANLKNQQRESALGDLSGLYSTDVGGSVGNLGATAANVNANTGAVNSSYDWATDLFNPILSAAGKFNPGKSASGGG